MIVPSIGGPDAVEIADVIPDWSSTVSERHGAVDDALHVEVPCP